MTTHHHLVVDGRTLAYDLAGDGALVVLAHGMGDSRHAYRFLAPGLVAAGYRVANLDLRGSGDSDVGWEDHSRTAIAGDILALVRHLGGGPAVVVGHSISGGAATIAAATAPQEVVGVVELAPFTRAQSLSLAGLARNRRYRTATLRLLRAAGLGSVRAWSAYLDLAMPTKPADWEAELARIETRLREPGRMAALRAMGLSTPADAGAQLAHVSGPVLVVQGGLDPDWPDPRAEGERILADLPPGLGELVVLDGVGHYPHVQAPDEVLALALRFLAERPQHA